MMKTLSFLLLAAALPLNGALLPDTSFPTADRQSMRIHMTVEPVFPPSLVAAGITEGMVRIMISVSHKGVLNETLVIAYTHEQIARAAVEALERWKFDPMLVRGEAVPSQAELIFNFKATGVVVSLSMHDTVSRLINLPEQFVYAPCLLRDLDRIPTPILADRPFYPKELLDRGVHGEVMVEFFIDETGVVRMPVVIATDHLDLGYFALEAVRNWRFEAPTRNGRPVLARVRQLFNFRNSASVALQESSAK